jgi:hypothetical protein
MLAPARWRRFGALNWLNSDDYAPSEAHRERAARSRGEKRVNANEIFGLCIHRLVRGANVAHAGQGARERVYEYSPFGGDVSERARLTMSLMSFAYIDDHRSLQYDA